jgi:protein TonB
MRTAFVVSLLLHGGVIAAVLVKLHFPRPPDAPDQHAVVELVLGSGAQEGAPPPSAPMPQRAAPPPAPPISLPPPQPPPPVQPDDAGLLLPPHAPPQAQAAKPQEPEPAKTKPAETKPAQARPDPPTPPAAPPAPPPVRLGAGAAGPAAELKHDDTGEVRRAKADTGNLPPEYPSAAALRREHGDVTVLMHVNASGAVDRVDVVSSSGSPRLDAAARKAALSWHFTPALLDGRPVPDQVQLTIGFELK